MNIIEAIKSGKPFRRRAPIPETRAWIAPFDVDKDWGRKVWLNYFRVDDILADDWEVEPKAVPITLDQFWDAYNKAKETIDFPNTPGLICDFMAKELGL